MLLLLLLLGLLLLDMLLRWRWLRMLLHMLLVGLLVGLLGGQRRRRQRGRRRLHRQPHRPQDGLHNPQLLRPHDATSHGGAHHMPAELLLLLLPVGRRLQGQARSRRRPCERRRRRCSLVRGW